MISKELCELIAPAFDDNVLNRIFKKSTGATNVRITDVLVRDSATNKGDSYLSAVVRFSLEGTVVNE